MHFLGIDTSAYTTSVAVVNEHFELVWEQRKLVNVEIGETGLAQSAAFFQHIQALPELIKAVPQPIWQGLSGVGVSMAPRPVTESYMPVFTAGYAVAQGIASAAEVPLILTSHQEGHLAAGLISSRLMGDAFQNDQPFLTVHLSGGTTELLLVKGSLGKGFVIEILGGTTDLHAGQFVDRVGVKLGLGFPAGKELELLARSSSPGAESLLPSAVKGLQVSFSGVETAAGRLIDQKTSPADVARAVEGCLVRTISKLIKGGREKTGLSQVLIVGGVSANMYMRKGLEQRLSREISLYWAEPEWSRDNAIGVAVLACGRLK